jgi:starvation-inducible outer membrane lipoprotein
MKMKKVHYILLITVAFLVSNCDTNDDGFYNNVFVDIPNLVSIEAHSSTYTVGEKLYIG